MIAASLDALAARAHARLPREPHLHVKRALGTHAREYLETLAALGGPAPGPVAADLDGDVAAAVAAGQDLEVLVGLQQMLERHRLELPDRPFTLTEAQPPPARDPFVEVGEEAPGLHAELNRALLLAEVAAATAAEVDFPTRLALARLAAEQLDATAALDAELESPWGSEPVDVSAYARLMALATADRVRQLLDEGARRDEDAAV